MIVHTLKLTNFGRLSGVQAVFGESTVGIEGKSGVGKSTLMHALRFAVTGDLPDAVASYRKDGGKHGKTVVDMSFSQKGQTFRIVRGITKTSTTREFYEPGTTEPVTSAKEVDRRMLELFGADPKAIEGCVFVPQGKIDEVLFGNDTERETRFMRMLSLTHIGAISRAIDTQLGVLRSQVVDFAPAMQEVENNTSVVQNQLDELQRVTSRTPVVQPSAVSTLESQLSCLTRLRLLKSQTEAEQLKLTELRPGYVTAKSNEASLAVVLADARAAAASKTVARSACLQWVDANQKMQAAAYEAARAADELARQRQHLRTLPATTPESVQLLRDAYATRKAKVATWEAALLHHKQRLVVQNELKQLQAAATELDKAYTECRARYAASSSALTDAASRLEPELAGLKFRRNLLQEVHKHGHAAQCPVCNSQFSGTQDLATWLSEVEHTLRIKEHELTICRDTCNADKASYEDAVRRAELLRVKIEHLSSADAAAARTWESYDADTRATVQLAEIDVMIQAEKTALRIMQEQGAAAASQSTAYAAAVEAVAKAETQVVRSNAVVSAANDQVAWTADNLFKTTGMKTVEPDCPLLQASHDEQEVEKLQATVDGLRATLADYEKAEASFKHKNEELEALQISLKPFLPDAALQDVEADWQAQLDNLREMMREANSRNSQAALLTKQLHECQQRKANIMASMERQAHLTSAIQRLSTVAKSFERTGAVRDFMRDKFAMLMQLINTHLTRMAAPFECRPAEKPMSFEFRRTDEESEWMDQCKLSGGQRVRASVAFLLAVQSLVIPDVGLLMLDEPSMHLDQESQENLRDLISNLSESLRREEKQLIVVDHCPVLMPAFRRVIAL